MRYTAKDFLVRGGVKCDSCKECIELAEFSIEELRKHHGKACQKCSHSPLVSDKDLLLAKVVVALAHTQAFLANIGFIKRPEDRKIIRVTTDPDATEKVKTL